MSRPKAAVQLVPKLLRLTAEAWAAIDQAQGTTSRNQWIADHFAKHFATRPTFSETDPALLALLSLTPADRSAIKRRFANDGSTIQIGPTFQSPGARLKKGK